MALLMPSNCVTQQQQCWRAHSHLAPEGTASTQALFLGCGDVRNILATAREASTYRSLKHLTVHLNDNTRQIIARAALLLLLVSLSVVTLSACV